MLLITFSEAQAIQAHHFPTFLLLVLPPRLPNRKREKYMKGVETKKQLTPKQREELLKALKARFEKHLNRHKGLEWAKVQSRLEANPERLWSLNEMESTGGEPDVVGQDK